jgi:succinylglutamate desuccinylase
MKNKFQRIIFAQTIAASTFQMFSNNENRGPNWKKELMPKYIRDQITKYAFLENIPEKHYETMSNDAITFYEEYLASALV